MAKSGFRGSAPRGGGGVPNQQNMLKQAQKMQEEMLKLQEELEAKDYSARAGGGAVKATVSGKRELVSLEIAPEAVDPDDVELLQDMIMAAVNEALRAAETAASENMAKLTGGLNLGF